MSGSDWSESSAWVTIPDDMLLDLIELGETVKEDGARGRNRTGTVAMTKGF